MKLAILQKKLGAASETFVTRHLNELNGGENVVIFQEFISDDGIQNISKLKIKEDWVRKFPSIIRYPILLPRLIYYSSASVPLKHEQNRILDFLINENVDAVLSEFGTTAISLFPVLEKLNIPFFTYFRGYDASSSLTDWNIRYSYKRIIPRMAGIFAVSPHLLENLSNIGVKWKQAHVIPSGVNTDLFKFVPENKIQKRLVSVGRFVPKKAPLTTIKVFAKVLQKHSDAELFMIGDGILLDAAKKLAFSLGVSKSINFMGQQPHQVIQKELSKASIFLLHSVTTKDGNTEGFPTAIQEALASGTAVISTRHGGILHFIKHKYNGLLVDEFDDVGYENAINKVLNDEQLRFDLMNNGRRTAEDAFDYKLLYNKLEEILSKEI